jgi:hypothetical protein
MGKFKLYLMDVHGNRELIYEGVHNAWYGIPVRPRPKPQHIPDRTIWPGTGAERKPNQPGTFYHADVYEGVPELPRGIAKYLRVFQQDAKTYSTWTERKFLFCQGAATGRRAGVSGGLNLCLSGPNPTGEGEWVIIANPPASPFRSPRGCRRRLSG